MYVNSKSYSVQQALNKLKKYCTYQDRCHKEVELKLKEMRIIIEASNQIIITLVQENYLNEERFAISFVRGKFKIKKWGKQRLILELKRRNISKYLINKAIKQISDQEYKTTFERLAKRKAESITAGTNITKKKKLADYLLYRGWESPMVYDKVNQLF
tara:strand:+ start:2397 stop:2870 length:474 start_codon:yes stop_codon:yes gene_type:complete